jgi:3D (Asp-Asp-Asp) domain-containing protein
MKWKFQIKSVHCVSRFFRNPHFPISKTARFPYGAPVRHPFTLCLSGAIFLLAGCARPLPTWEPPLARTEFQRVRTTAYFDGESDHRRYTNHNALGTELQAGPVNSAAADWSRWPAGTVFRLLPTGQTYVVDDYGWALAGRNTIDLYMPTRDQMDCWGVRQMDIQILQWGDPRASYATLLPRADHPHVERMLKELRPQLDAPVAPVAPTNPIVPTAPAIPAAPIAPTVPLEPFEPKPLSPT